MPGQGGGRPPAADIRKRGKGACPPNDWGRSMCAFKKGKKTTLRRKKGKNARSVLAKKGGAALGPAHVRGIKCQAGSSKQSSSKAEEERGSKQTGNRRFGKKVQPAGFFYLKEVSKENPANLEERNDTRCQKTETRKEPRKKEKKK